MGRKVETKSDRLKDEQESEPLPFCRAQKVKVLGAGTLITRIGKKDGLSISRFGPRRKVCSEDNRKNDNDCH